MTEYVTAIVAIAVTVFAVVSKRLSRSVVTGTMAFTALGVIVGPEVLDLVDFGGLLGEPEFVSLVLTGTLVIVLFTDASAINASNWRDDIVPARLLGIGLPLSIVFGWAAALVVLGDLEIWEAAVLGAMLAPTDAALGKSVVSNPRVPLRIRQALNIESGLNDGIAPAVLHRVPGSRTGGGIVTQRRRRRHRTRRTGRNRRGGRRRRGCGRRPRPPVGPHVGVRELVLVAGRTAVVGDRGLRSRHSARWLRVHRRLGRRRASSGGPIVAPTTSTSRSRCLPRQRATS